MTAPGAPNQVPLPEALDTLGLTLAEARAAVAGGREVDLGGFAATLEQVCRRLAVAERAEALAYAPRLQALGGELESLAAEIEETLAGAAGDPHNEPDAGPDVAQDPEPDSGAAGGA